MDQQAPRSSKNETTATATTSFDYYDAMDDTFIDGDRDESISQPDSTKLKHDR